MATKRQMLIQPYQPDFTENLGDNTGQYSDKDIGKAVVYNGDQMDQAAAGDEIVGFVSSVEPATVEGHSVGSVRKNGRAWAIDEAGTLNVGDRVQAGTPGTLGVQAYANVVVLDTTAHPEPTYNWVVIRVDAGGAGRKVLLEKV